MDEYLARTDMQSPSTWATEVEIFAASNIISRNRRTSDLHTFRFGIFVLDILQERYPVSIFEIELNFKFIIFCEYSSKLITKPRLRVHEFFLFDCF